MAFNVTQICMEEFGVPISEGCEGITKGTAHYLSPLEMTMYAIAIGNIVTCTAACTSRGWDHCRARKKRQNFYTPLGNLDFREQSEQAVGPSRKRSYFTRVATIAHRYLPYSAFIAGAIGGSFRIAKSYITDPASCAAAGEYAKERCVDFLKRLIPSLGGEMTL